MFGKVPDSTEIYLLFKFYSGMIWPIIVMFIATVAFLALKDRYKKR